MSFRGIMIRRVAQVACPSGFALCFALFAMPLLADGPAGLKVRTSRITGHATFLMADGPGGMPVRARAGAAAPGPDEFLGQYGHLFGISDSARQLRRIKVRTDGLGHTHTTYQQVEQGVPVFAGVIDVHQDPAGRFRAANGHFFPSAMKTATTPRLTAPQAERVARKLLKHSGAATEKAELVIVDPGWYGDPPAGAHLAWHVILSDPAAAVREAFFIDAHTRLLLDRWSMIERDRYREVHDTAGSTIVPGPLIRTEGQPPADSTDADRAYDYAGDTYDYYFRAFGRDSLDGLGLPLIVTVRWMDMSCPNAFWTGQQMVFCSGMVADDIMAHELTHGLTEYTAHLIYQNQSGQLNEAFSDIFGELLDLFNGDAAVLNPAPGSPSWPPTLTGPGTDAPNNGRNPDSAVCSDSSNGYADGVRWLIGEDAVTGAIRDLWSPGCFFTNGVRNPDRANSFDETCDVSDNGGVHSGSAIPAHAFAIMTDGKTFNGYSVTGIGPIKAGAVWYRALTTYLTPPSDFEDAYAALNQSAQDLIGTYPNDPRTGLPSADAFTAEDALQVDNALRAVEMNGPGRCGATVPVLDSTPPVLCGPNRHTVFADDFENGPNGWTVSNTNPPTAYDWVQTSTTLPFGRPGKAWFCEDPNIGVCGIEDEGGAHYLISPAIQIPPSSLDPSVMFTHYMLSEPPYDGGNVNISVNDGPWQLVSSGAFTHNPYNSTITTNAGGNPLRGQSAWTGGGGEWGVSVFRLAGLAASGDTIRVRFEFGKDNCGGITGWYLDDFEVFTCPSRPPIASDANLRTPAGTALDIALTAQDDGLPVPPGALSYTIMALPAAGTLQDLAAGPITQVPQTLANNGNQVRYTPSDPAYEGPDSFTFTASDGGIPPEGGASNTATVAIQVGRLEYFTEQFVGPPSHPFDLGSHSLTFRPQQGLNGYAACLEPILKFPVDPAGHTVLPLGDDDYQQISLTDGQTVQLYGQPFSSLFVCSNGYIVLGDDPGDQALRESSPGFDTHFSLKRVAALFNDLDPSTGGQILFAQLTDRVVVTFMQVPKYATEQFSTFQTEMFFDGTIRISWLEVAAPDSLVGLSKGTGLPADFLESDLSRYRRCQPGDFDQDGDVDQDDFGHLQVCLSGPGVPQTNPACLNAFMDSDDDIDQTDVALFRRCMSGVNHQGNPACAN